jgi:hypothetical protein
LGNYIIRNTRDNELEIQKINEYLNSVQNKINPNINNISASIRRDENDRPLRRPTTPMTNLSSTSNSQIFNQGKDGILDKRSISSKLKSNLKSVNIKVDTQTEENFEDNQGINQEEENVNIHEINNDLNNINNNIKNNKEINQIGIQEFEKVSK